MVNTEGRGSRNRCKGGTTRESQTRQERPVRLRRGKSDKLLANKAGTTASLEIDSKARSEFLDMERAHQPPAKGSCDRGHCAGKEQLYASKGRHDLISPNLAGATREVETRKERPAPSRQGRNDGKSKDSRHHSSS